MELRHLRYFVAVFEERNITRAADKLGMQQPPLSQQIQALEAELKARLFRRTPKGMEPTAAAQALYQRVVALLTQLGQAVESVRAVARGEQGRLAIGVSSSAAFSPIIPRLIRSFRAVLPGVHVMLTEDAAEELLQGLRADRIDIVFTRSNPEDPADLGLVTLAKEEMLAAVPSGHRRARSGSEGISLRELADDAFILYRRPGGPGLYDTIIAACRRAGFSPKIAEEALRLPSTLNFVAAGLGVSIVPASLRRLKIEGVAYARLRDRPPLSAPLNVAFRHGTEDVTKRFVDFARQSLRRQTPA
jgi:DNA-binding transcriptional LysR family regulator